MQQIGFLLRHVLRIARHLRRHVLGCILEVGGAVDGRLFHGVERRAGRLGGAFVCGSEALGVGADGVGGWLALAYGASFAGFKVGGILMEG